MTTYRTTPPTHRTAPADRKLNLVDASHALNRLRDRLHTRRLYPTVSYHGGEPVLYVDEIDVQPKASVEGLSYCWRKRDAGSAKFEAPADTEAEIDAAAGQIADQLAVRRRLTDEQLQTP
ncbi:hypothetical protein [Streptosporangium sp. NPDC002524]|uniref:hypothetical protein n=1 Tax=Streptosporangium sp. NPDC002524 TaxID=3154537 RepID=UPI00332907ED